MDSAVAFALAGGAVFVIGLLARFLRRVFLSASLVALGAGVVLGPEVVGVVDLAEPQGRAALEIGAQVTLAVSLTATGLQIARRDLRDVWRLVARLLLVSMPLMWLVTALGAWLLLDVPGWMALLLGAALTPTDPVIAGALVSGPLPEDCLERPLRRTVQLESGANDGLAIGFVALPVAFLAEASHPVGHWAAEAGTQIGLALVLGVVMGMVAGRLVNWADSAQAVEPETLPNLGVGLGLVVLGLVHLLGGSGILASFVAALAFSWTLREAPREQLERAQDNVEQLFLPPFFLLLGALLPWSGWVELGWMGVAFGAWTLLVRRPVAVAPVLPRSTPGGDRAFLAWFGPLGVSAIYYALTSGAELPRQADSIFAAVTLAVAVSVVAHSVTATPAVRAMGGRDALGTLRSPLEHDVEEERDPR